MMALENPKVQSYFNFINSWLKTEKAYGTLPFSNEKVAELLEKKCLENSTDIGEIDKLRRMNSVSADDYRTSSKLIANYFGGLYPTRDYISKFFLFYDWIVVEDSLAFTSSLENILRQKFMDRYFDLHYFILADNIDFLRSGVVKFINQDWKLRERSGLQSMNDLISDHTMCEVKEVEHSMIRLPKEISRLEISKFLEKNMKVECLKTKDYPNKKSFVYGVENIGPLRKCNVMSYLSLLNNGWPTSEFSQEIFILRSKFNSFPSLNQILLRKTKTSVRLSNFLLNINLPFIENLDAKDYINMKKDKEPYSNLRNYFRLISNKRKIDIKAEEMEIATHLEKIRKKMGKLKLERAKRLKVAFRKVSTPLCVCILSYFLFPPLVIPVSVWSFKETHDFFETLFGLHHKLKKIKRRNSFFSLWELANR